MTEQRTNFRRALDLTIREFGIAYCHISEQSGVSDSSLSRYLSGATDLSSSRLQKVIDALPSEARSFFFVTLNPTDQAAEGAPNPSAQMQAIVMMKSHLFNCTQDDWMELLGEAIQARRMTLTDEADDRVMDSSIETIHQRRDR